MRVFKNSFKYGQTSESFAQSMLSGDLLELKNSSLKTCINGTPLGYEGIEQRRGYRLNSVINTADDFKQFPLTLSKTQAQVLIYQDKIIVNTPFYQKYFITPLPSDNVYDITTIQDVLTNGKDQLFIASSRGIDVFSITNNFINAPTGSDILKRVETSGLNAEALTGATSDVYIVVSNVLSNKAFPIKRETLDLKLSGFYIKKTSGINIGDIVKINLKGASPELFNIKILIKDLIVEGVITEEVKGYFFQRNTSNLIYPSQPLPTPLNTCTNYANVPNLRPQSCQFTNIPNTASSIDLLKIQVDILDLIDKEYFNLGGSILSDQEMVRYGTNRLEGNSGGLTTWTPDIKASFFSNTKILVTSTQGVTSGVGFCMYMNTDNRLYVGYDNIAKASEVGKFTNFELPSGNNGDDLTATSPLSLAIQGVNQIKWIWKLRDRGTLYGTDAGLKLLNYGANSFRLGIGDISDIIPSQIRPISATINGIGGVAFINSTQDKVMFLASQSTLQTPVEDLTRFVDFFLNDPITKLVSVPYRAGEMTMVLTKTGKVYRLVTGNNDKYGWTQDVFDIIKNYPNKSSFPLIGKGKVWYLDNSTNLYYLWLNNAYVQTSFYPTAVYDISTYNNQLVAIFLIDKIPNVQPVKVICTLDLTQNTTADLWDSIPVLDYNFDTPNNVFINQDLNLPVYYPSQIDISFKRAIIRPSQMFLETHYDEYVGQGKSSKTFNRQIKNRVIHGDNLYDIIVGYKGCKINTIGNKEWFTFKDAKKTIKQSVNLQPTPISGDIPINPSGIARLLTCTIQSENTTPTIIRSDEYQTYFP